MKGNKSFIPRILDYETFFFFPKCLKTFRAHNDSAREKNDNLDLQ